MRELNKIMIALLAIGLLLMLYGYIAILIDLYFFWESKSIGWFVLFLGLLGLLNHLIKSRKKQGKKSVLQVIGMVLICFVLLLKTVLGFVIFNSDSYDVAKEFATKSIDIKNEIGEINDFGLVPAGGMSATTTNGVFKGNATIRLIAKGTKSYQIYEFYLFKDNNNPWEVYEYK